MTTRVKISHLGGSHPIEVYWINPENPNHDPMLVATLEKLNDSYENHVYSSQQFLIKENN